MKTKNTTTNETLNQRMRKKSVNIKWNSTRYFQVGLIISLLLVILVMETTVGFTAVPEVAANTFTLDETTDYDYVLEKPKVVTPKVKQKTEPRVIPKKVITDIIKVVQNTSPVVDTPTASITDTPIIDKPTKVITKVVDKPLGTRNVLNVEFVPIYPGCEGLKTNKEKITCMSDKINKFISKKFDTDQFDYLEDGTTQKIFVQFKINTNGDVVDILTRAPDKELEKEAKRVINRLPSMEPGRQGDVNVNVNYTIPITFRVDN